MQYVEMIYVVCSKSTAHFEILRLSIFGFRLFCGVMLVLISPTCADKFGRFELSVTFLIAILLGRVLARL